MNPIAKSKATAPFKSALTALLLVPMMSFAQSDLTAIIKGSEILVGGLITIFSSSKAEAAKTTVESVCIKNKMNDKIKLVLKRETEDGEEITKELIIQKDSKECFYDLAKGIYSYEIILSNDEVYKKGEYRFKSKTVITLKEEPKEETADEPEETEEAKQTKTPTG